MPALKRVRVVRLQKTLIILLWGTTATAGFPKMFYSTYQVSKFILCMLPLSSCHVMSGHQSWVLISSIPNTHEIKNMHIQVTMKSFSFRFQQIIKLIPNHQKEATFFNIIVLCSL